MEKKVLVATNARGIDVEQITLVENFDLPMTKVSFIIFFITLIGVKIRAEHNSLKNRKESQLQCHV